ncbi:hypothetical protein QMZ92_04360 [Streptomyces sp. HNM0645]|uniref:hypothetical protein n=1 Tax=Streptomyces sp. HNM0645 TaxID=2782343 RepID=UPI0024B68208|nr:hypothetical protein [Streptomyces sp. HNM0645]MDI9883651.1 hypothetical protein [Streptomyces sp. HNM0645]
MFAGDGDRWGAPRAKLLAGEKRTAAEPTVLTALKPEREQAGRLAELASALHVRPGRRRAAGQHTGAWSARSST